MGAGGEALWCGKGKANHTTDKRCESNTWDSTELTHHITQYYEQGHKTKMSRLSHHEVIMTLCQEAILVQGVTQSADKAIIISLNIIIINNKKQHYLHHIILRFNNVLYLCNYNSSGIKC